jgi:N-acetylmuramoyl-L-alanine amidase
MLTVRGATEEATVPVVETNAGPAIRADLVAAPLGGRVRELPGGHYAVSFPGVEFDVVDQVPFARAGDEVVPLAAAPFLDDGRLYLPFQLVAEALPRFGSGVFYDAVHAELRLFGTKSPLVATTTTPILRVPARADVSGQTAGRASGRLEPGRAGGRRRLVVVDAGHGGPDNGMTGPIGGPLRISEKDVTLAVAKRLAESLRARGVDVLMTRTRDTLIALGDRGRIANQSHGDLFISVHVNAANMAWKEPAAARGFETYFLAEAKTEEARRVERMENEAVRFETSVETSRGDPLNFIMNDMAQNEHLRESSDLATTIQERLGAMHPGPSRGVKQANFAVLRTSFMPAVLVEIGFGTNPAEAAFLADPKRQRAIADAIAGAAVEYLGHYERRVGAGGR